MKQFLSQIPREVVKPAEYSAADAQTLISVISELSHRRQEALRIYTPLPRAKEFHKCKARQRLARGSNRAAKTLTAAAEIAMAVTGQHPWLKYPKQDGRACLVGKDGRHLGEVMYRKLFRAGAFHMIRDEETGLWRTYQPWKDQDRAGERRPAPPLIPRRFIKGEPSWESKKDEIPKKICLLNGWELSFFTSLGKPPQGSDFDLVWFDEEIVDPQWYPEVAVRGLVDRMGIFVWSATPQRATQQLYDLYLKWEKERDAPHPKTVDFFFHIEDNKYLDDEAKQDVLENLHSEEEIQVRYHGQFAITSYTVYPEYDPGVLWVEPFAIPRNWTRYMVTDPGRQVCAVLFAACPPEGDEIYLYDELYLKRCTAANYAREVASKTSGAHFYDFIIDRQGSRVHETGSGIELEQLYSEALEKRSVKSQISGSGFTHGASDVKAGLEATRALMAIREDGNPRLKIFKGRLPNLDWEMKHYRYKRDPKTDLPTDDPEKRNDHLVDALRLLAMYRPTWHPPPVSAGPRSRVLQALDRKREKHRERMGPLRITLGPATAKP